jgi:predicted dehydrogenase
VKVLNANDMEYRPTRESPAEEIRVTDFPSAALEPFNYFANVIRGNLIVKKTDLSSLENNLIVVKILDAARESAKTGKTIKMTD